mmetsp:Transcript_35273/g.77056  ORF Transcript_35273/g.77056 Transcript_35273/m.77056 type:complete len:303 (-) Transcript_35273:777-1685(-)
MRTFPSASPSPRRRRRRLRRRPRPWLSVSRPLRRGLGTGRRRIMAWEATRLRAGPQRKSIVSDRSWPKWRRRMLTFRSRSGGSRARWPTGARRTVTVHQRPPELSNLSSMFNISRGNSPRLPPRFRELKMSGPPSTRMRNRSSRCTRSSLAPCQRSCRTSLLGASSLSKKMPFSVIGFSRQSSWLSTTGSWPSSTSRNLRLCTHRSSPQTRGVACWRATPKAKTARRCRAEPSLRRSGSLRPRRTTRRASRFWSGSWSKLDERMKKRRPRQLPWSRSWAMWNGQALANASLCPSSSRCQNLS